jgi:hypothetical protein
MAGPPASPEVAEKIAKIYQIAGREFRTLLTQEVSSPMAEDGLNGVKAATRSLILLDEAKGLDEYESEGEAPELDLLGLPRLPRAQERSANLTRAGRGRPPGSRNQSTEAWRDYITKKYGSPLEILAQMSRAPIEELAKELHCSRLDAFVQKRHATEALAGYIHPKLTAVTLRPPPTTLTIEGDLAHLVNGPGEEGSDAERVDHARPAGEDLVMEIAETGGGGQSVEAIVEVLLGLAADPVAGPIIRQKLAELNLNPAVDLLLGAGFGGNGRG